MSKPSFAIPCNSLASRTHQLSRRAFVRDGTLLIGGASLCGTRIFADETLLVDKTAGAVRIGMVTDLHYADKPTVGSRHYRETLMKLGEAANHFQQESPDFLVELGDLIDRADSVDTEMSYLQTVNQTFSAICKDRHYVLGNHCVDTLRKEEFLSAVAQPESYYSFDRGDFHFIVLDACFRGDGEPYGRKNFSWKDTNIPKSEVDWLRSDLQATKRKTVVFAHQRLDDTQSHSVINHAEVRSVLESSGNVLAVFQGHSHKNEVSEINGIHYCTMVAMVEGSGEESNAYAMMTLMPNGSIVVKGFRKQATYDWAMH